MWGARRGRCQLAQGDTGEGGDTQSKSFEVAKDKAVALMEENSSTLGGLARPEVCSRTFGVWAILCLLSSPQCSSSLSSDDSRTDLGAMVGTSDRTTHTAPRARVSSQGGKTFQEHWVQNWRDWMIGLQ